MITITGFKPATNDKGETFNMLELQGDIEMVKSKETGRFYATARKCLIASTFNDVMCEKLIGKEMKGEIERQVSEVYDYVIPETGETITLEHTWVYNPNPTTTEEHVFGKERSLEII